MVLKKWDTKEPFSLASQEFALLILMKKILRSTLWSVCDVWRRRSGSRDCKIILKNDYLPATEMLTFAIKI